MSASRLRPFAAEGLPFADVEREALPVLDALLSDGHGMLLPVRGRSMRPALREGDVVVVAPFLGLPDPGQIVLARAAGRVSTALADARIVRRQACYRPVTDDGLPLIGRVPGLRGAYVATGHGPWGILNAPATGLALAELVADGAASLIDLRAFDPARLPAAR